MRYFKEYPGIEFPEWMLELGFEDYSWHNDACARAVRMRVPPHNCICVWVEHEDRADREDVDYERFTVELIENEDQWANGLAPVIYRGESEADARAAILAAIPHQDRPTVESVVKRAKAEILADIQAGILPATVATFSELHDYVDANGYGGAFEAWSDPASPLWDAVQTELDQWLKGRHIEPS